MKKEGQGCSMVWRQVGDQIYKAYLVFPVGEKSMDKALLLSEEWFSSGGKIQKAHSFGRCFRELYRWEYCQCGAGRAVRV